MKKYEKLSDLEKEADKFIEKFARPENLILLNYLNK